MGFFKKIFSRKKSLAALSSESNGSTSSTVKKLSRKERKALKSGGFLSEGPNKPQSAPSGTKFGRKGKAGNEALGARSASESAGLSITGNHHPSEDYVRKPSFSSQRNQSQRVNLGSGSASSGTLSPNESRSPRSRRSHNTYEDNSERDNDYFSTPGMRDKNVNANGMVQFGGHNAFNGNQIKSSSPYQDMNDENRSPTASAESLSSPEINKSSPTDNHRSGFGNSGGSNLKYDQLQQFEQKGKNNYQHQSHHPYQSQQASQKMLQLTRLPNGQLAALDRFHAASPLSASSEFDLSTDAEDNEYNHIRHSAIKPMLRPQSPSSESEDDMDHDNNQYDEKEGRLVLSTRSKHYFSDSDHDTMNSPSNSSLKQSRSNAQDTVSSNEYDARGSNNGVDNSDSNSNNGVDNSDSNSNNQGGKSRFTFDNEFEDALVKSKRKGSNGDQRPASPTAFQKINKTPPKTIDDEKSQLTEKSYDSNMSPRAFAIKTAQNLRAQGKYAPEAYADSTDSELDTSDHGGRNRQIPSLDLLPPRNTRSQDSESKSHASSQGKRKAKRVETKKSEGVIENFADFETFANNEFGRTSKSVANPNPVSELLAQAQKRRMNRKGASQSVNSEPALNAAMLRQQLKLPYPKSGVSDAQKKLQKRKMEKENFIKMLNDAKNGFSDDSDKEQKVNESWLFDEVTGALGPRGVAADLESLGERSNKSKTSIGNKSHRSHRSHRSNKSYKSHKSSTSVRRQRRSDESVGSRHSRSSRYSVKSTKSYVSQMSQESRSVANDLIRLEMQLAMVNKNGENEVKKQLELDVQRKGFKDGMSVGENSIGVVSYASRKRGKNKSGIVKRARTTVRAPPGKLGIILANRTDAKGTVVSGVRTTSILADKISPGDRIIAVDGEDVSRMTVPEITAIMARKSDFERVLTVLITPQK